MKSRVISAIVMALLLIPLIYLGGVTFNVGIALISTYAYKEIIGLPEFKNMPLFVKIFGIVFFLAVVFGGVLNESFTVINVSYILTMFLFFTVPAIFCSKAKFKLKDSATMFAYSLLVAIGFSSLIAVRMDSVELFIYLVTVPIISDIMALVTGYLIGKKKLIPEVSPKKTVEGAIGGFLCGAIVSLIVYNYLVSPISLYVIIMTCTLCIFSQIGDLFFSKIKRENDVKDFSNLIPGHGGVLDRVDSLLFVGIIYLIFSSII